MPTPNRAHVAARVILIIGLILCLSGILVSVAEVKAFAQQTHSAEPAGEGLTQIFLPSIFYDGAGPSTPGKRTLVSESPYVTSTTTYPGDGLICVTYWVRASDRGNTTFAVDASLTHSFTVLHGSVTVDSARVVNAGATGRCDEKPVGTGAIVQNPDTAGCRFDLNLAAGETRAYTCLLRESPDAVTWDEMQFSPRPFGRYDSDYDRIADDLEQGMTVPAAPVNVVVMLTATPPDFAAKFSAAGGQVTKSLTGIDMLLGRLPMDRIQDLKSAFGADLMLIGQDATLPTPFMLPGPIVDGSDAAIGQGRPWIAPGAERDLDNSDRISVAVLDTGADVEHPALRSRIRASYSAVTQSATVVDADGQGTHVAAVIAGRTPDSAFEGVASGIDLVPVQAGTGGEWYLGNILNAVDWIVRNASIYDIVAVNSSLNLAGVPNPFWTVAVERAGRAGIVVVSAAGDIGPSEQIGAPGDAPLAVTVGAADETGAPARYSSYGLRHALASKPDLIAPGNEILSARSSMARPAGIESDYEFRSGAEVAAPQVTGSIVHILDSLIDETSQDLDEDNRTDEDPWNGVDDDGDDLIDEDLAPWWRPGDPTPMVERVRRVKSLLLMATKPTADNGGSSLTAPATGFGSVDLDAARAGINRELCAVDSGVFGPNPNDAGAWVRHVYLNAGQDYTLALDAPDGTDFDLYLFRDQPDAAGAPVVARRPGLQTNQSDLTIQNAGDRSDKSLTFSVRQDGRYFVAVRRSAGAGPFTVSLQDRRRAWTIMLYMSGEQPGAASLDLAINQALDELDSVGSGWGSTREVQVIALVDYDTASWSRYNLVTPAAAGAGDAVIYCIRKDYKDGALRYTTPIPVSTAFGISSSEINMGDPDTLKNFVAWGRQRFPAEHHALILFGDRIGHGWKTNEALAIGPGHDTESNHTRALSTPEDQAATEGQYDALTLKELQVALEGALDDGKPETPLEKLALLGFDMGQMATLEVAVQLERVADVLVAPQDPMTGGARWPYAALLEKLRCNPDCSEVTALSAEALATHIATEFAAGRSDGMGLTVIRLRDVEGGPPCGSLVAMAACVSTLGTELTATLADIGDLDDPEDNGQTIIHDIVRTLAAEMHDRSFVDLGRLAALIEESAELSRLSTTAEKIVTALVPETGGMMLAHTGDNAQRSGLSIFFPNTQVAAEEQCPDPPTTPDGASTACGFDNPFPSVELYADPATADLSRAPESTTPRFADLIFVRQRKWDEFLQAYFRPTPSVCAQREDGSCTHSMVIGQGQTATMIANGSSDVDLHAGEELLFYWDIQPDEDTAGDLPDYATNVESTCSEDCDRDGADDPDDDPEYSGAELTWTCTKPDSTFHARLMVHDDHHLLPRAVQSSETNLWNASATDITIYCAVPPQLNNDDTLLINGSTSTTQYRFVLVGNPNMPPGAQGVLVNEIPTGVKLLEDNIEADDGIVSTTLNAQGTVATLRWEGPLDPQKSTTLVYHATIDANEVSLTNPVIVNEASFYDGVTTRTLAISTPSVAMEVTPKSVAAGDVLTYNIVIPAPLGTTNDTPFSVQYSPGNNPLFGQEVIDFPHDVDETIDELNGFWLWGDEIDAGEILTFRFTMKVRGDIDSSTCGNFVDQVGYSHDGGGIIAFDGPGYEITCPVE